MRIYIEFEQNGSVLRDFSDQLYTETRISRRTGIPKTSVIRTLERCCQLGLAEKTKDGAIRLTFMENWSLGERQKRRLAPKEPPELPDMPSEKKTEFPDTKNRIEYKETDKETKTKPTGAAAVNNYFDKHSVDKFTPSQDTQQMRIAIFWRFWIEHYGPDPPYVEGKNDAAIVQRMTIPEDSFKDLLLRAAYFLLFQPSDSWVIKNMGQTVKGFEHVVPTYGSHDIRRTDKWQETKAHLSEVVKELKIKSPHLHQYLKKLSKL